MTALRIISTEYPRGAVVKLTESPTDQPVAKYVIDRDCNSWKLRRAEQVYNQGKLRWVLVTEDRDFTSVSEAIDTAIRACERIRAARGDIAA